MNEEVTPEADTPIEEIAEEDAPRVQRFDGDVVVEITEQQPVKRRVSEQALLNKREYLTNSIESFQAELDEVNAQLIEFYETTQGK